MTYQNMKHTPLPWTTKPSTFWVCDIGVSAMGQGIWSEAHPPVGEPFPWAEKEEDAAFIVHAVNCHYDLLTALDRLLDEIGGSPHECYVDRTCDETCVYLIARQAIDKARGKVVSR